MKSSYKLFGGALVLFIVVILLIQTLGPSGYNNLPKTAAVFTPVTADILIDTTAATSTCADAGFIFNTDCFVTIQEGIDAATSGQTVGVEAGTYSESVVVDKSLTLQGVQIGIAGEDHFGAESTVLSVLITASDVTVDGFSFTGTSA